jgi:hypothetical protein
MQPRHAQLTCDASFARSLSFFARDSLSSCNLNASRRALSIRILSRSISSCRFMYARSDDDRSARTRS